VKILFVDVFFLYNSNGAFVTINILCKKRSKKMHMKKLHGNYILDKTIAMVKGSDHYHDAS